MVNRDEWGTKTSARALRLAMLGACGTATGPNGCESAVEEIGQRLVDRGHSVTVYCRSRPGKPAHTPVPAERLGMRLVHLPALPARTLGPLWHTALSVAHATTHENPDAAFVFDAVNAPFVSLLRLRGIPTTMHVNGFSGAPTTRAGSTRQHYKRWAEQLSARSADALIGDAQGTVDYYRKEFSIPIELIRYGTRVLHAPSTHRLAELGVQPQGFHLVVTGFEPDENADVLLEGYRLSSAQLPLIVVGSPPDSASARRRIGALAADPRVRLLGEVPEQSQLDQLYAHSVSYLHGRSNGGTDPSLLRSMGARTAGIAWDSPANRDVLGVYGAYYRDAATLASLIEDAELNPHHTEEVSEALQRRASALYNWGHVTDGYEDLAQRLVAGYSTQGLSTGRRSRPLRGRPTRAQETSAIMRGQL